MTDDILNARLSDGTAYDLHGPVLHGPVDAPMIVLVHGLGLCRQLWDGHLSALSERYRVLNYDLYGHGQSAPGPQPISLSVYASQLAGILDELGVGTVSIVGFSIGGMINRRFAIDYPDRLYAMAVLNSPHDRGAEQQLAVEQRAQAVRNQGPLTTMDAAVARWFTPDYLRSNPEKAELVKQWRLAADAESYAQAAWVLANGVRELLEPDPPIVVPTLVMTGENDTGSTPAMSASIAEQIPGAELAIVPGLQHLGLIEQPALFTEAVLNFLDRAH